MSTYYTVKRGDCLSSIAKESGFSNYQIIYDRPENADFRAKRPNPNIIYPGDVLFIPDRELRTVSRPTDQRHKFRLKRPKVLLRLCVEDDVHRPYRDVKYRLTVGLDTYEDRTDGGGMVEQEIPADARDGALTIYPRPDNPADEGYTFELNLGDLDPVDETSGIDARLSNLGYGRAGAAEDGFSDEDRREALKAFQESFELDITGEADDATRSKLRQLHDAE